MSHLSPEHRVKIYVSKNKFADVDINNLVEDVTQLNIQDVAQRARDLQHLESAAPRDVEKASMVLGYIERLGAIEGRSESDSTNVEAFIRQVANPLNRDNLK